jgi:hypothetical protein
MRGRTLLILTLASWIYFSLTSNVYGQCVLHTPTEYGKNLARDMIWRPPHRWYYPTMEYRVQDTTRFWYSSDIAYAAVAPQLSVVGIKCLKL